MTHTDERSLERWRLAVENSQHECFSRTLFKAKNHFVNIRCISMLFMALTPVWQKRQGISACGVGLIGINMHFKTHIRETRTVTFSNISRRSSPSMAPPLYRHA